MPAFPPLIPDHVTYLLPALPTSSRLFPYPTTLLFQLISTNTVQSFKNDASRALKAYLRPTADLCNYVLFSLLCPCAQRRRSCKAFVMAASRSMESRVGRTKQRYAETGERLVAGVVPLNAAKTHVLLIQSTRRAGWVLPKGGWESDESCTEAAQREAWEEAGIVCTVDYDLGTILETRAPKQMSKEAPKALYQFYEVTVTSEETEWPEKHKRNRQWANFAEASEALKARPELLEALKRSTIAR